MDKIDLIYDTVLRIEKNVDERLCLVEKDISVLMGLKNRIYGAVACIGFLVACLWEVIKTPFVK